MVHRPVIRTPPMSWLTDRRLLTAALLAWIAMALIGLVFGPSLGHDEAAFAIAARGEAPAGVWLYRSDGTIAIAKLGIALGGAVWQLRLASAVLGTGVVIAVFAVGRAAFSARTGAWAAALIAGAHPMAHRSAELLSDLPAVACLLGGIAILVGELDRAGGPRWHIVAAGPIFAAAFYVRYGSAPVVTFAIAAAMVLWWRAVVARPVRVLAMVATLAVLVIPHLLRSQGATGTMLGILKVSAGMPRRAYVGEGLVTYLTSNPFLFYGFLIAPVMVAGVLGLPWVRRKAPWYLALIAIAQVVSLGLQSHGQPRYVFLATALLIVLGVDRLARVEAALRVRGVARLAGVEGLRLNREVARLARVPWPRLALGLVALSWLGVAFSAVLLFRHVDRERAPILEAARVIRADTGDRPCAAVAMIAPQLMWYSRCEVFVAALLQEPLPADRTRYAVTFTRWPIDPAPILAAQHLHATLLPTADPRTTVWLLR
jgi:4-amino-4-deoxy-L-arabinose transferase-like glycosyltransferase